MFESPFRSSALNESTIGLLHIAASVCNGSFAVLHLDGKTVMSSQNAPGILHVFDSVPLIDRLSQVRGTLAVLGTEPRKASECKRELLAKIAAQIAHHIEIDEQQRAFIALLDAVAVGAYAIENGRFCYVNENFAATLGYTKEEILTMDSVTNIIVDEHREFIEERIQRRAEGDRRDIRFLTKVRRRDGTVIDAEVYGSVGEMDRRSLVLGAAVDMTDQCKANGQLFEREEYFRALTENSSDLIVILDKEGRRSYVSSSVERILGYTPVELVGQTYFDLIHPEDRDAVFAAFNRLTSDGRGPVALSSYRFMRKDGSWRILEAVATNLLNQSPVRGVVLNIRDVTDRNRLERELEQLQRLTSLGRLAAQVAHEFNNVMMGIQPVAEIIRRHAAGDPQLLRSSEMIAASISRGKRMTTDILRFGRPAQLALKSVNVQELVRQLADEIRPILGKDIALQLQLPETPLYALADAAQLSQVLLNLMLNARDAMQATGGVVTLDVSPGQEHDAPTGDGDRFIHIAVSDSGHGIKAEDLPYIFEPLFTTKRTGCGLGLSVVFQIVKAHQGHIRVKSEPGSGAKFDLFIPVVSAEERQKDSVVPAASASTKKVRILLVEDDEAVATGLRWLLEAVGVTLHVITTGAEVLPALSEFRPDAVVLDLALPDEQGSVVYQRMAPVFAGPVIFSSGHALEHEIDTLLRNPRTAFLMKPYSSEDLLRIIHELMGRDD